MLGKSESLSTLASRNVGVASSNCLELLGVSQYIHGRGLLVFRAGMVGVVFILRV